MLHRHDTATANITRLCNKQSTSQLRTFWHLPDVATANVRDLGSKQVQEHEVGEAFEVAHAQVCEEAAVQIEGRQAGQA